MIIYIHGFGGSGQGSKAKVFREYFGSMGMGFIAPSLSYVPDLAIATLEELIESYNEDIYLIGSSLGGYYTTYLSLNTKVKKFVLINPSVNPTITLKRSIGNAPNFYDNSQYEWSQNHLAMLERYRVDNFSRYDEYKQKCLLLLQKGDDLLDYKEAKVAYEGAKQIIEEGGSHSFDGIERYFESIKDFLN